MDLRQLRPRLARFDVPLVCALMLLTGIGLLGAYSTGGEPLLYRQLARLAVGSGVMVALAHVEPGYYARWAPWFYAATLAALVAVFLVGSSAKGAQRWLAAGGLQFQPAEVAKIATPLMVAAFLAKRGGALRLSVVLAAGAFIALPVVLIGYQPDLGTAVIIAVAGAGLLFIAGVSWRLLGTFAAAGFASLPFAWYWLKDYQRERVITFLDPDRNPLGAGYQVFQSKIAIGSGGVYGKGWLNGTQSQLDFLPERSTDFVFAVLAEEFGLLGVLVILALVGIVIFRGLWIAGQSQEPFGRLVAAGLVLSFFMHVFVNVGMVSGLLPVVGLPLPLISYGGTSLVTTMAAFGIVMSMFSHRRLLAD